MPILRPRLSRTEAREYGRCLREMRAEGIDVNSPDESIEHVPAVDITVVGGLASLIFNLRSGLAGYAIQRRLVASRSGLILPEPCEVTTEFDRQIELGCFDAGGPLCTLGQSSYLKAEVLNDRFPLRFHRRGDLIEGVILATGLKPIPQEYVQGMTIPLKLTFWDQFGNEFSAEPMLSVDRSTTPRQRLVRPQSSVHDSGGVPDTREPSGGEGPDVAAALRAADGENRRTRRKLNLDGRDQPLKAGGPCAAGRPRPLGMRGPDSAGPIAEQKHVRRLLAQSRELLKQMQTG
jgi:hypothetical protein